MDRWVTPPKQVTSPTWGPPPPCKQALDDKQKFANTTSIHELVLCTSRTFWIHDT